MKEIIQQTIWPPTKEMSEQFGSLGMADFADTEFVYGKKEQAKIRRYTHKKSAWAQEFLPNVYIGNVYALYGHYDIRPDYIHYDLILDLSDFKITNSFIALDEHHYVLSAEDDGTNFYDLLTQIQSQNLFEKINHAHARQEKVLINCQLGMSRSATVAILYMMETYKISVIQAYRYLQKHRPIVEPNPGYFSALCHYETSLAIEDAPQHVAKAWLEAFVRNPTAFKVEQMNEQVILTPQAEIGEQGRAFIDLLCYLKMLRIPFQLSNCTAYSGTLSINAADYNYLASIV